MVFTTTLAGFAAASVWLLPGAKRGDVDPLSAILAVAALAFACFLAWGEAQRRDRDIAAVASRLATEIREKETADRNRILGDPKAIDVRFTLRRPIAPHQTATGARPHGTLAEIADYFTALEPRRMVITGLPGAGKTLLAIDLVLALIKDRNDHAPVPVRLPLSSWSEIHPGPTPSPAPDPSRLVTAWLARSIAESYSVSRRAADALITAGMILPVLDGLDEMDSTDDLPQTYQTRARRALDVLNAYQLGHERASLVLTCRSGRYRDLEVVQTWARDAAHVALEPVAPIAACDFIRARVSDPQRWRSVLDEINARPSGPLARTLSTPWRLTIAVTVHEQQHPASGAYLRTPRDLLNPALNSEPALRDHLVRLLVSSTLTTHPPPWNATPTQARTWLGTLAGYLNANAAMGRTTHGQALPGTDIAPLDLWPLAGPQHVIRSMRMITTGIVAVTVACLITGMQAERGWPPPWQIGIAFMVLSGLTLSVLSAVESASSSQLFGHRQDVLRSRCLSELGVVL
ncbi:NACHT domain-containing protein [Yinghuangia sp. ASG 101]|uniref:NACHT domain-containing protein n=1 Tax=Yinghuangia sp. ASG 101 TaxID=2896848 RepID=UPI001E333C2B|nr:NACHT domain-containing protein [Yinghuangia sp. ASG 101]UGQ11059.1 NACHT domain-containing protein [Yinghuangia sp. ASG 101]